MITRRKFVIALGAGTLAAPLASFGQQSGNIHRIGYLSPLSPSSDPDSTRIAAFRQGLRDLGYVEGKNIVIEFRRAEEKYERLPRLAAELVRQREATFGVFPTGRSSA